MIDLSYLTEEEQEVIMAVVKRDADLKKSEEERVKQWEMLGAEESRLKYITGKWFYEMKSQRHQDKIHGSEIVMASMKHKKPMTVELLSQSWRSRPSKRVNDIMMPNPESSDGLNERASSETQQNRLNFSMRPSSRPRHNPFNKLPMDPNFDFSTEASEHHIEDPSVTAEVMLNPQIHEAAALETKYKASDPLEETDLYQKPVPKKRTKLFKPQNSFSDCTSSESTQNVSGYSSTKSTVSTVSTESLSACSDSISTLSTPSMSSNPGIVYPQLRGILKRNYNCSSSDSKVKSQLPEPLKHSSPVSTSSGSEQTLEEHLIRNERTKVSYLNITGQEPLSTSFPLKSALPELPMPVQSTLLLNNPAQTEQMKPTVQPRLSLRSSTLPNNEYKATDTLQSPKQTQETNSSLYRSASTEPDNQQISEKTTKGPSAIPRIKARSALEALLDKPLNENPKPVSTPNKLEGEDSKMSRKENQLIKNQGDQPHNPTVDHGHEPLSTTNAFHKADAFRVGENKYSPFITKITGQNKLKTQDYKDPLVESICPTPTEEHGDSISKVLEWFSKSTESSDILDFEDNIQETENLAKFEDIDFDDDIIQETKPENNVYLIIPKQKDEKPGKRDSFLNETELTTNLSDDKKAPFSKRQSVREPPDLSKTSKRVQASPVMEPSTFYFQPQNVSPKEKIPETDRKKAESRNAYMMESTAERMDESQLSKIVNLKSYWKKGNAEAPRMLVGRPNKNGEMENQPLYLMTDYEKEPPRVDISSKLVAEKKKKTSMQEALKVDKSNNPTQEHLDRQETVKDKLKEIQPALMNTNEIKDRMVMNPISDRDAVTVFQIKPSSPLLECNSLAESNSAQNVQRFSSVLSKDEEHVTHVDINLTTGTRTKEKEASLESPPISGVYTQPLDPVLLTKQSGQQQDNREERLKDLKSFWEKEAGRPKLFVKSSAADNPKSSLIPHAKMNKRFTKSEYDLTSIGTEFVEDDRNSPNFTILPLRDTTDGLGTAKGMNSSQFKTLRDFWAGSSNKQKPVFKSQRSLDQEVSYAIADTYKNQNIQQFQSARTSFERVEKESGNTNPQNTERGLQSPAKEKTVAPTPECGPKANIPLHPGEGTRSHPQSQKDSLLLVNDSSPAKPPGMLNNESRQQTKTSSKGALQGEGNSLFAMNMNVNDGDNDGDQENVSDTTSPHVRKPTEKSTSASRTTPESNQQVKKPPESTTRESKKPLLTSGASDSQPLSSSIVPQDYQHYLEISENSDADIPPKVKEQTGGLVCTPFSSSSEKCSSVRCSPVQCNSPTGSPELPQTGSLGPHSTPHPSEDDKFLNISDTWSHARTSQHYDDDSPVLDALRRASDRPMYHQSLEDFAAIPISSTSSPPSSTFSDLEHMRKLSKSVPSFLDSENDGGQSESSSDYSSRSGVHWRNRPHANLSSKYGMASVAPVKGSIISASNGDLSNINIQGNIQVSLSYRQKFREFHIFVVQCKNLAAVDAKKNRSDPYVKSYLLPDKANLGKRKTSVKKKTLNPIYNEILRYRVRMELLKTQILNLSVWHKDTFGRNRFLGETEVDLSTWDFGNAQISSLALKPRTVSSIQPTAYRGEMRLAIRFLPQISQSKKFPSSGEVHIWVRDCKNLPLIRGSTVDPFVKCPRCASPGKDCGHVVIYEGTEVQTVVIFLKDENTEKSAVEDGSSETSAGLLQFEFTAAVFVLPDTSKKSRQKTRVLKRTANPIFNHTMVYDGFTTEDLKEACVELTVWDHDRLADHLLGVLKLGLGTGKSYGMKVDWMDSSTEEVAFWERMMNSPNEWVEDVLPLRMVATLKKIN